MFDRLERSPLRLVRTIYFKVMDGDKKYYLIEKAFASKYDGKIKIEKITEEEYEEAVLAEERTEEVEYEKARSNIKNKVKEFYINE